METFARISNKIQENEIKLEQSKQMKGHCENKIKDLKKLENIMSPNDLERFIDEKKGLNQLLSKEMKSIQKKLLEKEYEVNLVKFLIPRFSQKQNNWK
jgi:hypothetical protein